MVSDTQHTVFAQIREEEIAQILTDLVRIPTVNPPGDVREAVRYCADILHHAGFSLHIVAHDEAKPNLVARYRWGKGPTLLFNAHLDVVPIGEEASWTHPPFGADYVDGRIYGRGANDDKASVAAQLVAALALVRSQVPLAGELVVTTVADEEIGGQDGTAFLIEQATLQPDFVIVGEPTDNRVCIGERGGTGIIITTYGRTAHGALPWEGVNAIEGMAFVIMALRERLWPVLAQRRAPYFTAPSSATISIIHGGVKTNVVPDQCSITIDRRLIPGETPQEAIAEVRAIAEEAVAAMPGIRVSVAPAYEWLGREATLQPLDSPLVQTMLEVNRQLGLESTPTGFNMATDGRFFAARGFPTIIYGPGDPATAHKPDEWVALADVVMAAKAYALATLRLLHPCEG